MLLTYVLLAVSFALSSYFFIHLKALKLAKIENDIAYSIAYILITTIYFPKVLYGWLLNPEQYIQGLYNG